MGLAQAQRERGGGRERVERECETGISTCGERNIRRPCVAMLINNSVYEAKGFASAAVGPETVELNSLCSTKSNETNY